MKTKHLQFTLTLLLLLPLTLSSGFTQPEGLLREVSLRGNWKFAIGDDMRWASPDYNVDKWEEIRVPSTWEDEGFYGYDGYAWYRTTFDGRKLREGISYYLNLGNIDDIDETFLNGKMIGFSGKFPPGYKTAYGSERIYKIPKEYIDFDGWNTIAVRVYDHYVSGGIVSGSIGIYSSKEPNMEIELAGMWKFRKGSSSAYMDPNFNDEEWDRILVPMPWEQQNMRKYDGYGMYRKTINLTDEQARENWMLILGKIDDFDETFVNGESVGETRDNRDYGRSMSFQELRIYMVPARYLKPGKNVIAVKVEDMGNVGGIYTGPVGMIRESDFDETMLTRYYRDRY